MFSLKLPHLRLECGLIHGHPPAAALRQDIFRKRPAALRALRLRAYRVGARRGDNETPAAAVWRRPADIAYAPSKGFLRLGTVIGFVLALPVEILSSSNINRSLPLVSFFRFILALIRTLPTLIIALVCALIFSLGTFSGTVAIAIFTFGIVAKMLFESIETIDMGPFEAMEALGANKFQAFWSACVPQILPVYLSHSLYCFEMNIRASAILGYVGAGGLGITINERIGWRDYNSLGMVLLSLFVVVVAIDFFSEYLRKKLS